MPKVRIDGDTSYYGAQRFAQERGLDKLGQDKLKPLADDKGVVSKEALERLARVADIDTDGKLSPAERKRIDAYLKDRTPVVADAAGGNALALRAGAARKPVEAYIEVEHSVKGKDLVFELDIGVFKAGSGDRDEYARQFVVKGLTPNTREDFSAVEVHRYGTDGADASVGYANGGVGAGYLAGVADKAKGAVLVNLSAAGAIAKDPPEVRTLFTPAQLAKDPAVKQLAKKEGLDPKKIAVGVLEVSFHSDFVKEGTERAGNPKLHTLMLTLELTEPGSRKKPRTVELSALVEGTPVKALGKLDVQALEPGVQRSWGFIFPPSVELVDDSAPRRNSGVRDSGGSRGGGGEVTRGGGGGGEHGGSIGGGGE